MKQYYTQQPVDRKCRQKCRQHIDSVTKSNKASTLSAKWLRQLYHKISIQKVHTVMVVLTHYKVYGTLLNKYTYTHTLQIKSTSYHIPHLLVSLQAC